ncbi:unnamed protein product [Bursaphelenchus xylophilus]|uniref:Elongator complex protein 4 n=1 Tax=Bursaphelenchus xylophilus TaxID=6326 RepID=A0A1I7SLY7_BURXY|nr:unnamed protein product [Bursaphelenchus xylophilus]CAG9129931.1 unnamed protein product [Bursaphelenchus xylophilus]
MIRSGDAAKLPGTKIQNRCAVTSVGLDAVDGLMGGGLPVHNLYILSETSGQKFGTYFMRYYVAEGLNQSQKVVVVGLTEPEYLNEVPSCSNSVASVPKASALDEDMSIAWRYSTMPSMNSGLSSRDRNKYDLANNMDISNADLRLVLADSYKKLFEELVLLLQTDDYVFGTGRKMLRIVINDFGSPLFEDSDATYNFITKLKVLLLHSNAVCMLYLNEKLFSTSEIDGFITVADNFFRVEPHDEEIKKDLGLEDSYDGRFHIVKLPLLNSFATNKPACVDLVFERHRHYLEIKILHLPAVMGGGVPVKSACQTVADSF